jgi:hypothetical protein
VIWGGNSSPRYPDPKFSGINMRSGYNLTGGHAEITKYLVAQSDAAVQYINDQEPGMKNTTFQTNLIDFQEQFELLRKRSEILASKPTEFISSYDPADFGTFTLTWNGGKSATLNWAMATSATNLQKLDPQPSTVSTWTVAGNAEICGSAWDPSDTKNDMTKDTDGIFKLVRTGVEIAEAKDYFFKVVADHSWDNENYGNAEGKDQVLNIPAVGTYDITFTFNEETKETGATATVSTGIKTVSLKSAKTAAIYNLQGQRIDQNYRGIAIMDGKKVVMK